MPRVLLAAVASPPRWAGDSGEKGAGLENAAASAEFFDQPLVLTGDRRFECLKEIAFMGHLGRALESSGARAPLECEASEVGAATQASVNSQGVGCTTGGSEPRTMNGAVRRWSKRTPATERKSSGHSSLTIWVAQAA